MSRSAAHRTARDLGGLLDMVTLLRPELAVELVAESGDPYLRVITYDKPVALLPQGRHEHMVAVEELRFPRMVDGVMCYSPRDWAVRVIEQVPPTTQLA